MKTYSCLASDYSSTVHVLTILVTENGTTKEVLGIGAPRGARVDDALRLASIAADAVIAELKLRDAERTEAMANADTEGT